MVRRLSVLAALVTFSAGTAAAQDPRAVLQASVKAMGGTDLKTITYSGAGWSSRIGQTYGLSEDWPKYEVINYTRVVDYDAKWSREDFDRRQGNYPTLGGAPMAHQHITSILSGTYAWDLQGDTPAPLPRPYLDGVSYNDLRQLELEPLAKLQVEGAERLVQQEHGRPHHERPRHGDALLLPA